ncbi:hypothetical protein KUH03_02375 [Sphingobacterium sp. E70]|uniref:hypothetical protein n=1 Tax=Sphingobacterium sp. E70 TaxID=2853439 RepID=UPI00211CDA28|nr:hypothetical protein [Sphingobacterium sp. E70]ULT25856.1 hypothetical protein KUH03_02375 [Sphingobacterium sp. E70]
MEKIGLVEKDSNERDARVSYVKLSTAGDKVYKEASVTADYISKKLLDGMAAEDLEIFSNQLKSLGVISKH